MTEDEYIDSILQDKDYLDAVENGLRKNKKIGGRMWLAGIGPKDARVMIVTPIAAKDEVAEETVVGRNKKTGENITVKRNPHPLEYDLGITLKDIALRDGLDFSRCYCVPMVRYAAEDSRYRTRPKTSMMEVCKKLLEKDIERIKPSIIVTVGKHAFDRFVPGVKLKESDIYGAWFYNKEYNCRIYPTIAIGSVTKPEMYGRFSFDFRNVCNELRILDGEPAEKVERKYETIHNSKELMDLVLKLKVNNYTTLSVDCEWEGHQHVDGKLRSLQICWAPGCAAYIRFMDDQLNYVFDVSYEQAGKILGLWLNDPSVKYIGHHLSADLTWMHYWLKLDYIGKGMFDSEFALQSCDEASDLGLDALALRYTDLGKYDLDLILWKKANPNKVIDGYGLIPDDVLIPYACLRGDAKVVLEDGSTKTIEKMYTQPGHYRVKALDRDGNIVNADVLKVVRNPHAANEAWYKVLTRGWQSNGKTVNSINGPAFTPDHNILTNRGYVPVIDLEPFKDKVATQYKCLTHEQKELIFGSLLGDMGIVQRNGGLAGLAFSQVNRRAGCADWKAASLQTLNPIRRVTQTSISYRTAYTPVINELIEEWPRYTKEEHKHRRIIITPELVKEWLSDLALAVWYQDDGTLSERKGKKASSYNARIYFKSVNNDHLVILDFLRTRFGEVTYLEKNRMFNFSTDATSLLCKAIARYVSPDVQYKLIPEFRLGKQPDVLHSSNNIFYNTVEAVVQQPGRKAIPGHGDPDKFSYCLEVREHGNFLTRLGFVANCMDVDTVMRAWPVIWANMEKQGLVDYYNNILNPMVTDVFTQLCLKGIPVDRKKIDEMRELYNWAKQELEKEFRTAMVSDAANELQKCMDEEGIGDKCEYYKALISSGRAEKAIRLLCEDKYPQHFAGEHAPSYDVILTLVKGSDVFNAIEHYRIAPEFNIRSKPQMQRWLFSVKKYEPVKSTSLRDQGMPAMSWDKVMALPPEKQKLFTPASDKSTLEILARRYSDPVIEQLLELNAVGNICKAFLKPAEKDDDGNVIGEKGLHYWLASDDRIHGMQSCTETGRPRS